MIYEINDEARRDDPVKTAFTAAKQKPTKGNGNHSNTPKGKDKKEANKPNEKGKNKKSKIVKMYCPPCGREHLRTPELCYFDKPNQAPKDWQERNAKKQQSSTVAATSIASSYTPQPDANYDSPFSFAAAVQPVQISEQVRKLAARGDYKDRTILDTGATNHICNNKDKFILIEPYSQSDGIQTGAGITAIQGIGTIQMNIVRSTGDVIKATFSNVLYAPGMFLSVLSHSKLRAKGLYFHGRDEKLYTNDEEEIAFTPEIDGIPNFLEAEDQISAARVLAFASAFATNRPLVPQREVTLQELHQIYGHAGIDDLKKLVKATDGIKLTDVNKFDCTTCQLGKSTKQISRKPPQRATKPFQMIHMDVVGPIQPEGIDGERYWLLFTDDYTRYRWIECFSSRTEVKLKIIDFHRRIKTQFGATVATYHLDNDKAMINTDTKELLRQEGAIFRTSTPHTQHQNGVAESSNRLEETKVRCMLIDAGLPKYLWPYAARYATDLLNLSLTTALPTGKTPQHMLNEFLQLPNPVPNLSNMRQWGIQGYVHLDKQRRVQSEKFEPRSKLGHLIGREGSRIYVMWDPVTKKTGRVSSVQFNKYGYQNDEPIGLRIRTPEADPPPYEPPLVDFNDDVRRDTSPTEATAPGGAAPGGVAPQEDPIMPELGHGFEFEGLDEEEQPIQQEPVTPRRRGRPPGHRNPYEYVPENYGAPRRGEISGHLDKDNIVTSKRVRRPPSRYSNVALTLARCFATALTVAAATYGSKDDPNLPPEPTTHKQALRHQFASQWIGAEGEEYEAHEENGTWIVVVSLPAGVYALPTKWVYKYKFDEYGKLIRFKARLVVCGNRQVLEFWQETYAAVARATTLKLILALIAVLNLEADQLDAITAFLNGKLDDEEAVYIRLPDGRIVKLSKALYGLRRSPRLWYNELSGFLISIGYLPLEADPCVFQHKQSRCFILAYVDDLILVTVTKQQMTELKQAIMDKFKCRDMGPVTHYLGLRILRNRTRRSLEISMEPYLQKLGTDFKRTEKHRRTTPFDLKALKLPDRKADDPAPTELVHQYQTLIGKLLYPACLMRADVAFHVGYLGRAVANPTQQHLAYAYQVLDYLYAHRDLVMAYEAAPNGPLQIDVFAHSDNGHSNEGLGLHGYSDASFADAAGRKSTSGYLFKLAGGTICHKSTKQRLVTTSTTEAEYVALTYAAKEAAWLQRLLHQLGYTGSDLSPIKLYGDNEPSIKLTQSDGHHERTKHVDIYYHYIKDQVRAGAISLSHVRTQEMAADGLTKPLQREAHERFLSHLGLRKPTIQQSTYVTEK
jgi:transposase InsO family protein